MRVRCSGCSSGNVLEGTVTCPILFIHSRDSQRRNKRHPFHVKERIIFMSMHNDIDWTQKHNEDICGQNSSRVSAHVKSFPTGCWTFLGPGDEEKWYGTLSRKPEEKWNDTAYILMQEFAESGHPVFRCSSPLSRKTLTSKGGGANSDTAEQLLKIMIGVNLLCIIGAVAKRCNSRDMPETSESRDGPMSRSATRAGYNSHEA